MEKDGKTITWGDADQLILLPLESPTGKIMKINMSPDFVDAIPYARHHVRYRREVWGTDRSDLG